MKIKRIVIHCSASEFGDVELIRQWHIERGWRDIGYNAVIYNGFKKNRKTYDQFTDGLLVPGRGMNLDEVIDDEETGAHVKGYNSDSIGLCLIGDKTFSLPQIIAAVNFCRFYASIVPEIKIVGHYELDKKKTCPNIDMEKFRRCVPDRILPETIAKEIKNIRGYM